MTADQLEGPQQTALLEPQKRIVIPAGRFEVPLPGDNNFHRVIQPEFIINGNRRRVPMLHQLRPGDCVLANFLNTQSLETAIKFNTDGQLLMTVQEARQAAIKMRQRDGEDWSDIISPDSALSYSDVIRLFSNIHEIPPQQDDIMTVEGRRDMTTLQLAAIGILEYLDTYKSGLCSIGLGYHSRSIRKLQGDNYALIDPMNPQGVEFMHTKSLMQFLATQMNGHPPNDNFFFFVRN